MTLHMNGIKVLPLPTWPDDGFLPSSDGAARLVTSRTKAIVLVTPNNPTGAIYPPSLLESFNTLAQMHGIALILDETYRDFAPVSNSGAFAPHSLFEMESSVRLPWRNTLIHLFSFSKSYAIPGQRLGAIIASPSFIAIVRTVLDCIQVCTSLWLGLTSD
jgi:aspartate/methionine/tyrosine aminotransferase